MVGTVDNFLRPVLVGRDAKMPDLLILIGTLGGLFLFGPIGFIVGPIVCGLFLTVWDIYGATFREVLPPVTSSIDQTGMHWQSFRKNPRINKLCFVLIGNVRCLNPSNRAVNKR